MRRVRVLQRQHDGLGVLVEWVMGTSFVCVCVREKEREIEGLHACKFVGVCVCVCVCVCDCVCVSGLWIRLVRVCVLE